MCLAIPAKITELKSDQLATVDIMGVTREISVDLCPQAVVGDFVLVHAGFAIEVVSEEFAQETIDLINQFPELVADDLGFANEEAAPEEGSSPLSGLSALADEDFIATSAPAKD